MHQMTSNYKMRCFLRQIIAVQQFESVPDGWNGAANFAIHVGSEVNFSLTAVQKQNTFSIKYCRPRSYISWIESKIEIPWKAFYPEVNSFSTSKLFFCLSLALFLCAHSGHWRMYHIKLEPDNTRAMSAKSEQSMWTTCTYKIAVTHINVGVKNICKL